MSERTKTLPEIAQSLLDRWDAFQASYANQEEAYYKLAKYAHGDWEALRVSLSALTNTSGDDEALAWWHKIVEASGWKGGLLSKSPENPWSQWLEEHRDECEYTCIPLYARPQSAAVRDEATWRSMETAPRDGTPFIALEKRTGGRIYVRVYEWVGAPNYWHAKREGVCIRPNYQDQYEWTPLPSPPALHSTQEG